jgi:chorismate dehydratase
MLEHPLRAGRIVYTNDLPIYAAFDAGAVRFPGTLIADVPAALNAMLAGGRLDLSPISAFAYARHADRLALLPELCIGSRRDVWSVVCVSRRPLEELSGASIAVTRESASGRNLLRVLLERRFGLRANLVDSDDPYAAAERGEPALLIGDRAIDALQSFPPGCVHDLGRAWHAWTGRDMVYAVWAVRRDVLQRRPDDVRAGLEALLASRNWGASHETEVVAAAEAVRPRSAGFYAAYYETLNFTFDAAARAGLQRYFEELHALGAIDRVPETEPDGMALAPREARP